MSTTPQSQIAHEIRAMAGAAAKNAADLAAYADAVEKDFTVSMALADEYVGPMTVLQIMDEVERRTAKPNNDRFLHTLTAQFGTAQRGA